MKKFLNNINCIFLTIILLTSCEKFDYEKYFEQPQTPLEDLPSYSYFKTGTYWIYKDSVTNSLDSIYVFADTNYLYHQTNTTQAEGDYMFYGYRAYSNYDSCVYYYSISMGYYIIETKEVGVLLKKYKGPNYIGATYTMTNRFVEGDHIIYYAAQGITYFKSLFDVYTVNQNQYQNVAQFFHSKNETDSLHPTLYYFAKNVGILEKRRVDNSSVWKLIRSNIIQ